MKLFRLYFLLIGLTTLMSLGDHSAFAQAGAAQDVDPEEAVGSKPGTTEINLKNADIAAIIRIFSRKTGRNYILDENVKGKVTIYLPGKVSSNEAIRILDSILALKGFTSVPIGENLWKIVLSKDAKQSTIPTITDELSERASAAMVTRILPLKYVSADDIKQLITPLVSGDGLVNAYTGTNSLIVIDQADNINRVASIIESIDVPSSDRDMTIIPVQNADAVEIAQKLNEILGQAPSGKESGTDAFDLLRSRFQENTGGMTPPGSKPAISPGSLGGGKTVTARAREPKITADERTNSIIVVADEDTTARVRALVAQLDSKIDRSGNKFYVYRCQHAKADELAEVLGGLGDGSGSGTSSRRNTSGSDGQAGLFGNDDILGGSRSRNSSSMNRSRSNSTSRTQDRLRGQTRNPGQSRSSGERGVSSASLGENISITADPATNSLIIFASKQDYEKLKELLEKLDIKRRQVLVEAMLLEVGVEDSVRAGMSFLGSAGGADGGGVIKNDNGDLTKILSDPGSIQNFSVAAASAGTLTLPGGLTIPSQSILLTAAQSNRNINILSSPTILTTDNEEAEIVVGQNVPFISSTSTSDVNLNNTFNQVDRQDVGITLRITPQISSNEFVNLKIFTEVSDLVADTQSSTLGPTTRVRTSDTTVILKDAQMVVLGGLIADAANDSNTGIPYLKDIPVLGHLFRFAQDEHRRSNLLIFITPRIIEDQYDHRELTVVARDKMDTAMAKYESLPRREEVLHNPDIDNVAEASVWEGPKPSTILPPVENTAPLTDDIALKGETQMLKPGDVLELRVAPKVPQVSAPMAKLPASKAKKPLEKTEKPQAPAPAPEAQIAAPAAKAVALEEKPKSGDLYIVMKLSGGKENTSTPFYVAPKINLVGILVPKENAGLARGFFSKGKQYSFGSKSEGVALTTLGIFESETDALRSAGSLNGHWYTPSPYEMMNFGAGPWWKADSTDTQG